MSLARSIENFHNPGISHSIHPVQSFSKVKKLQSLNTAWRIVNIYLPLHIPVTSLLCKNINSSNQQLRGEREVKKQVKDAKRSWRSEVWLLLWNMNSCSLYHCALHTLSLAVLVSNCMKKKAFTPLCFNNCSFPCGSRWSDTALFLYFLNEFLFFLFALDSS